MAYRDTTAPAEAGLLEELMLKSGFKMAPGRLTRVAGEQGGRRGHHGHGDSRGTETIVGYDHGSGCLARDPVRHDSGQLAC